jgi:hypothetical protein
MELDSFILDWEKISDEPIDTTTPSGPEGSSSGGCFELGRLESFEVPEMEELPQFQSFPETGTADVARCDSEFCELQMSTDTGKNNIVSDASVSSMGSDGSKTPPKLNAKTSATESKFDGVTKTKLISKRKSPKVKNGTGKDKGDGQGAEGLSLTDEIDRLMTAKLAEKSNADMTLMIAVSSHSRTGLALPLPAKLRRHSGDDVDDDITDDDDEAPSNKKGKRKKRNPDADLIAQTTEETLQMMDIDPESAEGKKQRRRIRNRMSAQLHRERKKEYIETLENYIRQKDGHIARLEQHIRGLEGDQHSQVLATGTGTGSSACTDTASTDMSSALSVGSDSGASSSFYGYSDQESSNPLKRAREEDTPGASLSSRAPAARNIALFGLLAVLGLSHWEPTQQPHTGPTTVDVHGYRSLDFTPSQASVFAPGAGALVWPSSIGDSKVENKHSSSRPTTITSSSSGSSSSGSHSDRAGGANNVLSAEDYLTAQKTLKNEKHTALWTKDARVLQFFPGPAQMINESVATSPRLTLATINTDTASTGSTVRKRHLRAGSSPSTPVAPSSNSRTQRFATSDERGLVPATSAAMALSTAHMSHVLMTEGHALLHPSLARAASATSPEGSSEHRATAGATSGALSTWLWPPADPHAHAHARHTTHQSSPESLSSDRQVVSVAPMSSSFPQQQLTMLLPLTSVHWAKLWPQQPEDSSAFDSLLRDLKNSTKGPGGNEAPLWVEITAHVVKAQLVRNVNITADV